MVVINKGVKTLFATHYHELTDLARTQPRVRNYSIALRTSPKDGNLSNSCNDIHESMS